MYHNSHFDKAHKAVFAPACMCVYDRACLSRCAAGHAECTPMFISKYHGQACRTAWWENGITAICSSAACCAPSLWVLQLHISISRAHAACHLAIRRGIWPSEKVAHVTEGSCRSPWNVCLFVTALIFLFIMDLKINRTQLLWLCFDFSADCKARACFERSAKVQLWPAEWLPEKPESFNSSSSFTNSH